MYLRSVFATMAATFILFVLSGPHTHESDWGAGQCMMSNAIALMLVSFAGLYRALCGCWNCYHNTRLFYRIALLMHIISGFFALHATHGRLLWPRTIRDGVVQFVILEGYGVAVGTCLVIGLMDWCGVLV
jgi:hypothetical protein